MIHNFYPRLLFISVTVSLNPNTTIMSSCHLCLSSTLIVKALYLKFSYDFNIYGMWDHPKMLPCSYSTCGIISTLGGGNNSTSGAMLGGGII